MAVFKTTPKWLRDMQYELRRLSALLPGRTCSNFDEENLIERYVRSLGIKNLTAVDIGAGNGISSSNTYKLFAGGWTGLAVEADIDRFERLQRTCKSFRDVTASRELVQPGNITRILRDAGIEREFGVLSLDIDGKQVADSLKIPTTHDDRDTVAWRQWHHWNKLDSLTVISIPKGKHILTLHVTEHGNMNFDYLEFTKQ